MKRLWIWLMLVGLAWGQVEKNHADHEQLRALLKSVESAMNGQKYNDLQPYFHPDMKVTVINQDVLSKLDQFDPYFRDWIGPGKYVKSLKMSLTADALTEFYGEGESRFGVVRGSGVEDYDLSDGRRLEMKTRWTATVVKHQGKWKILSLHLGANFYRNPIVEQFQKAATTYGILGLLAGSVAGGLLVFVALRKRA
jgi:hypothetical protein